MRRLLIFALILMLAACEPTTPPHNDLPTLMALPTETEAHPLFDLAILALSATPPLETTNLGATNIAQAAVLAQTQTALNATVAATGSVTAAPTPTNTPVPTVTATPSITPTPDQSATAAFTASITVTPSLTITETPTRTPTNTPLPTEMKDRPLFELAILALSATPPPYVAPLTLTPTGFVSGNPGGALCLPPQGGFGSVYAADPALAAQIGCSLGLPLSYPVAIQTFERGTMVYIGTSPSSIYVLYSGGTYTHYPDTWVDGVDPVSGGETPPAGLLEPIRGFGKVWRNDPVVRNGLGWATATESGATGTLLQFQSGQMIALPPLTQVAVLTTFNTYRLIFGSA